MTTSSPARRALFQQRVAGDAALLELARLRFAQAGMAAEVYADTPEQLEQVLGFVAPHPHLPTVHLNRGVNVLHRAGRDVLEEFATRFAGRVWGLVVHDKAEMAAQTDELVRGLRALDSRLRAGPDRPFVFLEYAAGLPPQWFAGVAEQVADLARISFCIDTGHVGIKRRATTLRGRSRAGTSVRCAWATHACPNWRAPSRAPSRPPSRPCWS